MITNPIAKLSIEAYRQQFGSQPAFVALAPGRINLLGEHLDYNGGFVMPAAIDKYIAVAIGGRQDTVVKAFASDLQLDAEFTVTDFSKPAQGWLYYLKGPLQQCIKLGYQPGGFNMAIAGNIPHGAGMSSSAAFENGVLAALDALMQWHIPVLKRVQMAQMAEHEFAGVKCGIMDMYASMFGKKDQLMCLDCDTLACTYHPFVLNDLQLVLCNSGVKHALAESAYNQRRNQCEQGLQLLKKLEPTIEGFRDVNEAMLMKHRNQFDAVVFNRLLYVVQEIERVEQVKIDLQQQDFNAIGQRMCQTHGGLSQLYEVSCAELDAMVAVAKKHDAVLGSRLMGGGFGGCTISLVRPAGMQQWLQDTAEALYATSGIQLQHYEVMIENGVSVIEI